jgi:hypothetical protein
MQAVEAWGKLDKHARSFTSALTTATQLVARVCECVPRVLVIARGVAVIWVVVAERELVWVAMPGLRLP